MVKYKIDRMIKDGYRVYDLRETLGTEYNPSRLERISSAHDLEIRIDNILNLIFVR